MIETFYKVVKIEDNKLWSICVKHPQFKVEYKRNITVFAPIGGIMVFETLGQALNFARCELGSLVNRIAIFECFADTCYEVKFGAFSSYIFSEESSYEDTLKIKKIWDDAINEEQLIKHSFPPGTRAFKHIKLTEYICELNDDTKIISK